MTKSTELANEEEVFEFSGKLIAILGNGNVIYDGIEGHSSEFPLTKAELAEVNNQ